MIYSELLGYPSRLLAITAKERFPSRIEYGKVFENGIIPNYFIKG